MRIASSVVACTLLACAVSLPAQNVWQLAAPTGSGPGYAVSTGMAYCDSTGRCVLFGGTTGSVSSDETWEYDGASGTWTQLFPAASPGARHTFGCCYDSLRDVVVVFGGRSDGTSTPNADTWEYAPSTNTWTNVTPSGGSSPQGRWGCSMAFDVLRGVSVLYAGWGGPGVGFTNDTWEWDGASWTQVVTAIAPSPRDRCTFCYDLVRGRCVLFGGTAGATGTWEYDGVDWTPVPTPVEPPGRQDAQMVYDSARGVCVLSGGRGGGTQYADCWEYHGALGNWRRAHTAPSPSRNESSAAFDASRGVVVLFGGRRGGTHLDTWEHAPATAPNFAVFGSGCAGSNGPPGLDAAAGSVPALGATLDVELSGLNAVGGVGVLMFGASDFVFGGLFLPVDLGLIGWNGCTAYVSPETGVAFGHAGSTHTFPIPIPNQTQLQLLTFYVQALLLDAGAANGLVSTTPAAEIIVY